MTMAKRSLFSRYTGGADCAHVSLRTLFGGGELPCGEFVARAEFSGSEGCYVEVARWNEEFGCWQKFAFLKFFGGEYWRSLGDEATAERLASIINKRNGSERVSLIHRLPVFCEQPKTAAVAK